LFGRGLFPDANGTIAEAEFTGTMAPDKSSVMNGHATWTKGQSGDFPFTLQWSNAPSSMTKVKRLVPGNKNSALISTVIQVIDDPSKAPPIYGALQWSISPSHPDVVIPPLAAEGFASFPEDYRAILRPSHDAKLMTVDSLKAPCNEAKSQTDPNKALEIGKFALRDLEYDRADCWLKRADDLKSQLAAPLIGLVNLEGWGVPKDPAEAFRTFTVRNDVWSLYFREQCYLKGIGTTQNAQEAKRLDIRIQMSLSGEYVLESIGLDKIENQRNQLEAQLDLHPPMKITGQSCQDVVVRQPGLPDHVERRDCQPITEVDHDAIKKALDNFEPTEPQICTTDLMGLQTCQ